MWLKTAAIGLQHWLRLQRRTRTLEVCAQVAAEPKLQGCCHFNTMVCFPPQIARRAVWADADSERCPTCSWQQGCACDAGRSCTLCLPVSCCTADKEPAGALHGLHTWNDVIIELCTLKCGPGHPPPHWMCHQGHPVNCLISSVSRSGHAPVCLSVNKICSRGVRGAV